MYFVLTLSHFYLYRNNQKQKTKKEKAEAVGVTRWINCAIQALGRSPAQTGPVVGRVYMYMYKLRGQCTLSCAAIESVSS